MKLSDDIRIAANARAKLRHGRDVLWQQMEGWAARAANLEGTLHQLCEMYHARNIDELLMNLPPPPEESDDE